MKQFIAGLTLGILVTGAVLRAEPQNAICAYDQSRQDLPVVGVLMCAVRLENGTTDFWMPGLWLPNEGRCSFDQIRKVVRP